MAGVLAARRSLGVGPGRAWPHEWTAIKRLLACGAHESAAYQQPINTGDVKNAINLQERLQLTCKSGCNASARKMAVASGTRSRWTGG